MQAYEHSSDTRFLKLLRFYKLANTTCNLSIISESFWKTSVFLKKVLYLLHCGIQNKNKCQKYEVPAHLPDVVFQFLMTALVLVSVPERLHVTLSK